MYLSSGKPFYEEFKKTLQNSPEITEIYHYLVTFPYRFLYSYDEVAETITYLAYLDAGTYPPSLPFFSITVNPEGRLVSNEEGVNYTKLLGGFSDNDCAFYVYLYEKEVDLASKGLLDEIYLPIRGKFSNLSSLNPADIEKRRQIRESFSESVQSVLDDKNTESASKSALDEEKFSLITSGANADFLTNNFANRGGLYSENFSLSFSLKQGKKNYNLTHAGNFFRSMLQGMPFTLPRGATLTFTKELFDEESQGSLLFLLRHLPSEDYYGLYYSNKQFGDFVYASAGGYLTVSGRLFYIQKEKDKATLTLNPDETLSFYPNFKGFNQLNSFLTDQYVILFDSKSSLVSVYDTKSRPIGKLYRFFYENGPSSYDTVKDIFKAKLVGVINLTSDEEKDEKGERLTIELYVDLLESGSLVFKTFYKVGEEAKDKSLLQKNIYYLSKMKVYLDELQKAHAIENGSIKDEPGVLSFLQSDLTSLKKTARVFLSDTLKSLSIRRVGPVHIEVNHHLDYLEVKFKSDKYSSSEIEKILAAYKKKKKYFLLNGNVVLLDEAELEKLNDLQAKKEKGKEDDALIRLPFYEAFKLNSLKDDNLTVDFDTYLVDAFKEIKNFEFEKLSLSPKLTASLREYQVSGVKWLTSLAKYSLSGILADDMGLGKTLETIAFVSTIKEKAPILVVAPKSVLYNWVSEFKMWDDSIPSEVIDGSKEARKKFILGLPDKEKKVYITSYDSLRNDIATYSKKHFSLIVLDEAQYIKNAYAEKSKAVKALKSSFRLALTGTPIENSLSDLWSIFDFLMPGYLEGYQDFKEKYMGKEGTDEEKFLKDNLSLRTLPFVLRRRKNDVLKDLPEKTVSIITVTMEPSERKLYEATLLKGKKDLKDKAGPVAILALLTRLREICVDPASFIENYADISSKLEYALVTIQEAIQSDHKVLVFSSFTRVLDHLKMLLETAGITSYYIQGSTKSEDRLDICTKFNSKDDVKVTLVSLKAGGTGLNLHGADVVIHLDPWWNLAAEEQATDRAYRIGQKRPVSVFKLICHDSVEEKVVELQKMKKELSDAIIKNGEEGIKGLSEKDIAYLLG